ncbi:Hypothetical protein PHPALM_7759 [Phytophthora palmivora]|uniref:Pol protein n=1 Tax=Phytophthora palmivora TaxID=4796 RepID=A0A2P4YBI7_9STRA|nr:Hypothetical protein PHPALM_7759 [Phytophthora palmivora]
MATQPTFYVERLKRYHDPLNPSPRTEEGQGESSPPQNETESSGQPELPVSEPVTEKQAGTYASHTKGMTIPNGKSSSKSHLHRLSLDGVQGGSRNSAVNTPVELMSLTTKSVHIVTEDL